MSTHNNVFTFAGCEVTGSDEGRSRRQDAMSQERMVEEAVTGTEEQLLARGTPVQSTRHRLVNDLRVAVDC